MLRTQQPTVRPSSSSWGPLSLLPPELILRIFYLSLSHYRVGWDDSPPPFLYGGHWTPMPFLGLVCKAWQDFVYNTPELWTEWRVFANLNQRKPCEAIARELGKIDRIAKRSKGLPLAVQIWIVYADNWTEEQDEEVEEEEGDDGVIRQAAIDDAFEELGDFLVYHCERFQELHITAPEAGFRKLTQNGGLTLRTPLLRGLDIRLHEGPGVDKPNASDKVVLEDVGSDATFQRAALVSITPHHVSLRPKLESDSIGHSLKSLCLYTTEYATWAEECWYDVLKEMRSLEHLVVAQTYQIWDGERFPVGGKGASTTGLWKPIELPNLRTLYWFQNSGVDELGYVFTRLHTPSLVHFCWNAVTITNDLADQEQIDIMASFICRCIPSGTLRTFLFGHHILDGVYEEFLWKMWEEGREHLAVMGFEGWELTWESVNFRLEDLEVESECWMDARRLQEVMFPYNCNLVFPAVPLV